MKAICDQEGDYLIGLKGNQKGWLEEAKSQISNKMNKLEKVTLIDKNEGRITEVIASFCPTVGIIDAPGAKGILKIDTIRFKGAVLSEETRYFLTPKQRGVKDLALAVRRHWAVENNLHGSLDITFNEDGCRAFEENISRNKSGGLMSTGTNMCMTMPLISQLLPLSAALPVPLGCWLYSRKCLGWSCQSCPEVDAYQYCSVSSLQVLQSQG